MAKTIANINVPKGIKYISEFTHYEDGTPVEFNNCILNKGCTGVGGTHLFLTDDIPTVICSPRVSIIESKAKEFGEKILAVQKGVYDDDIKSYLIKSMKTPKIITTNDSFWRVKGMIGKAIGKYRIVVDEYHMLFSDSSFKSDAVYSFLEDLKDIPNKIAISATPIEERFLNEMPVLSDMDIVNLVWPEMPQLYVERVKTNNPALMVQNLIEQRKNNFVSDLFPEMNNMEYVFSYNSIEKPVAITKKLEIAPDKVSFYCANTLENRIYILQELGAKYDDCINSKNADRHTPITFWTSTMDCGADWYSDNAHIFVVSDTNMTHTSVDLGGQLVQIAGRLRTAENPNKNHITLIYNTSKGDLDKEMQKIEAKWRLSVRQLKYINGWLKTSNNFAFSMAVKAVSTIQSVNNYDYSYVMYNEKKNKIELNKLKYLSDKKMCEVQYGQYKDITFVDELMKENGYVLEGKTKIFHDYVNHVRIASNNVFEESLQQFVEIMDSGADNCVQMAREFAGSNYGKFKAYYDIIGSEKIKALKFKKYSIVKEYNFTMSDASMKSMIDEIFKNDSFWMSDDIKEKIKLLFDTIPGVGIRSFTAKILGRYGIVLKRWNKTLSDGSRKDGYRITRPSCS